MRCLKVCNKRKLYDERVGLVQDFLYEAEMGWGLKRLLSAVNVIVPAFIRPHPPFLEALLTPFLYNYA